MRATLALLLLAASASAQVFLPQAPSAGFLDGAYSVIDFASGTTSNDWGRRARTITTTATPELFNGHSLTVTSSSSQVTCTFTNLTGSAPCSNYTIMAFFRVNTAGDLSVSIGQSATQVGGKFGIGAASGFGAVGRRVIGVGGNGGILDNGNIATATWYHMAVRFNNTNAAAEFFVNGQRIGTAANNFNNRLESFAAQVCTPQGLAANTNFNFEVGRYIVLVPGTDREIAAEAARGRPQL
jgi:hypothetical protein